MTPQSVPVLGNKVTQSTREDRIGMIDLDVIVERRFTVSHKFAVFTWELPSSMFALHMLSHILCCECVKVALGTFLFPMLIFHVFVHTRWITRCIFTHITFVDDVLVISKPVPL